MIKCKKCHELIGENISQCPFCRTEITDEDRRNAIAENERLRWEAEQEAMEEYSRREKRGFIIFILYVAVWVTGMFMIALFSSEGLFDYLLWGVAAAGVVVWCVIAKAGHFGLCPYCEEYMGKRGLLFREYCPKCGGRLR